MKKINKLGILLTVLLLFVSLCSCAAVDPVPDQATDGTEQTAATDAESADDTATAYGYQSLKTDAERAFYETFGDFVRRGEAEPLRVDYTDDVERLTRISEMYCYDHPEVFWVDSTESIRYVTDGASYLEITVPFSLTGAALESAQGELETAVKTAVATVPVGASDFEKECAINDYLVDHVTYNEAAAASPQFAVGNEHNAYGALVEGSCVCDGYACAYKLLSDRLGMDSCIIFGSAVNRSGSNEFHAWNCVKLEGEWYHLDVTWNAASDQTVPAVGRYLNLNMTTQQATQERTILPLDGDPAAQEENVLYNYFVPDCTATKYNYIRYKYDLLSSDEDFSVVENGLTDAAQRDEEYYCFRVDNGLDYDGVYQLLISYEMASMVERINAGGTLERPLRASTYLYSEPTNRLIMIQLAYED